MAQLGGAKSIHQEVVGSVPGKGTQPGWGTFGNESMFSSLFLPLSLKLINIPLDKDFKKTFKEEKQKVYKES